MNDIQSGKTVFRRLSQSAMLWLFAALSAQTAVNHYTPRLPQEMAEESATQSARQLHPQLLRIMSFGHLTLAVDWLWLKCLIDPATAPVKKGQHPALYYRADTLTELDPAFYEGYIAAGHLLAIVRQDFDGALALSTKGQRFAAGELPRYPEAFRERFWGDAWWTHVFTAYLYLFEFDDLPRAASAFQSAALVPGAPEYLQRLGKRLEKPAGRYEVGLRLLNFMIAGATDAKVKARLEERRRSLFLAQYLFDLDRAFREYLSKIPEYRVNPNISSAKLNAYWSQFTQHNRVSGLDPFGGKVFLSPEGHVTSTTPYQTVFGIR